MVRLPLGGVDGGIINVRLRLTIAYDGSGFAGWQVQKTGTGVQERIEQALASLLGQVVRVHSSSRTDAGVHALGMVVHFDVERNGLRVPVHKLAVALNSFLPPEIRVVDARSCSGAFHARFDASAKEYRYFVWNHRVMNPLLLRRAWHVPGPLDVERMRRAARSFLGTHDFRSFAAHHTYEVEDTVRTVAACAIRKQGRLITFVLRADGFLYKMCRGIVGTLVQVGQGKLDDSQMASIIEARDRRRAGMSAPAEGLVLWRVSYSRAAKKR
jgi:tRNA pseudouridine38-40 synthase